MHQTGSHWTGDNMRGQQERDLNFISKCIQRRSQLEKIIFTYNNFHHLHPRFKDLAEQSFFSEDPLLLWNFENETLLNSPDVEKLMNQQNLNSYSAPTEQQYKASPQNQQYYNGSNLVSSIDASYQQVQQPMPTYTWNAYDQGTNTPQYLTQPYNTPQQMASVPFNPRVPPPNMMIMPTVMNTSVPSPQPLVPVPTCAQSSGYAPMAVPMQNQTPNQHYNYQQVIYDPSGRAYQQVIVTQKVLVPLSSGMSNSSSGCSTYSRSSVISDEYRPVSNFEEIEEVNELNSQDETIQANEDENGTTQHNEDEYDEDDDYEEEYDDYYEEDEYEGNENQEEEQDALPIEENYHNRGRDDASHHGADQNGEEPQELRSGSYIFEYTLPEDQTTVENAEADADSLDSESIRVESSSSVETPEPEADLAVTRSVEIKKEVVEDQWKVVSNKKRGPTLSQLMTEQCRVRNPPKTEKTCQIAPKIVNESAAANSNLPEDKEVQSVVKLTKKEKKQQAAAKAKQLETDDDVLEAAFQEKQQQLKVLDLQQGNGSNGSDAFSTKKKKKNKTAKEKVIVTSVTVSPLPMPPIPPHVMHNVKTKMQQRIDILNRYGRVPSSNDPMQKKYLDDLAKYELEHPVSVDEGTVNKAKQFIASRIAVFKAKNHVLCFSRILIYEVILVEWSNVFLADMDFLSTLFETGDTKCDEYEEAFISFL